MQYTARLTWRTALSQASTAERWAILDAIDWAERQGLLAAVEQRCVNSDLGISDCRELRAHTESVKWARHARRVYVVVTVRITPRAGRRTFKYRSRRCR